MPQIFDTLRNGVGYGRGKTVVHVPHPRDSLFGLYTGVPLDELRRVTLLHEEQEALRLADLQGLTQAEAAERRQHAEHQDQRPRASGADSASWTQKHFLTSRGRRWKNGSTALVKR